MAVVVRLQRGGIKKKPIYRVVVADQRFPRDGRYLEVLGNYNPQAEGVKSTINIEKLESWIAKGARLSDTVARLYKVQKASA